MKNYVNAKVFYVMKIQKNDGIDVPSNMASDGTDLRNFPMLSRDRICY